MHTKTGVERLLIVAIMAAVQVTVSIVILLWLRLPIDVAGLLSATP